MDRKALKSDALLLLTAAIWGFAFVAQRIGMEYIEPFAFNGIRFALGVGALTPLLVQRLRRPQSKTRTVGKVPNLFVGGILIGLALFIAASLQQIGIVYTTAGKAGFITGLYVVLVPLLGRLIGHHISGRAWIGAIFAAFGMYLLSVTGVFGIALGDGLVFASAFFWAIHVLLIDWVTRSHSAVKISVIQFSVCSVLSLIVAFCFETNTLAGVLQAAIPLLYGGVMSVGVAYTLQVVAQKAAPPAHAAIILSLESVFAVLGGWLILGESLSARGLVGCALMLAGMIISQKK